jgi:hypothetical protein
MNQLRTLAEYVVTSKHTDISVFMYNGFMDAYSTFYLHNDCYRRPVQEAEQWLCRIILQGWYSIA